MMQETEIKQLMRHVEATLDLKKIASEPLTHWASLPLCVIDSVWSIQSKYETQVCPLVDQFCRSHSPPWDGTDHSRPPTDSGPTLRDLVHVIDQRLQNGHTYETLFDNCQRTSSRSGILKAEAVHRFARAFLTAGINQPSDLRNHTKLAEAEKLVKMIPGQGTGTTFTYFLMLAGEDDFVKSDTHIRRFVSDALFIDWRNLVSADRAAKLVKEVATRFAVSFPGLAAAKLDHAIWAYQKGRTRQSPRRGPDKEPACGG